MIIKAKIIHENMRSKSENSRRVIIRVRRGKDAERVRSKAAKPVSLNTLITEPKSRKQVIIRKAHPGGKVMIKTVRERKFLPEAAPVQQVPAKKAVYIKTRTAKLASTQVRTGNIVQPTGDFAAVKRPEKQQKVNKKPFEIVKTMRDFPIPAEATIGNRETEKKLPDRWSDCGQIFYTGGKAYAITAGLRTICLGARSRVQEYLDNGRMEDDLNPFQKETLVRIKERLKEGLKPG
jgi:hypothetical protein